MKQIIGWKQCYYVINSFLQKISNYMGKGEKILYIKAQWLGDIISWIPKLIALKEKWYKVYQTFYDMRYRDKDLRNLSKTDKSRLKKQPMYRWRRNILEILKKNWLIYDIIDIPYGVFPLLIFIIKNFKKFNKAVIPIKTRISMILWKLLSKEISYTFEDPNDTKKYKNIIQGESEWKKDVLYKYKKKIVFNRKKISLPKKYITIFPSLWERSPQDTERIKVIEYIIKKKLEIVIIWWTREQWFVDSMQKKKIKIINLINKTNFEELIYVLEKANINICCNGWIMRLANLLNKKNINIHTVSAYLMEPQVDNKYSYNIRPYKYQNCQPCEAATSRINNKKTIKKSVFYNTKREWECRLAIKAEHITSLIEKILNL